MLNKIILQGRLTKEPELKQTQSGISTLLFTIAWSEKYKDVETKCFMLCRAWRQTADFISTYFRKGQEILIEGHMITEEWKEGESVTHCVIDKAHFCGSRLNNPATQEEKPKPASDSFMEIPDSDLEELPFK